MKIKKNIPAMYILPLAALLFTSTGCSHSNSQNKGQVTEPVEPSTKSITVENNITDCSLNMDTIRLYYPENDVTSGRTNKPDLIKDCSSKQNLNFGFYNLIDRKTTLIPPIVAQAIVSFEKSSWNYSDDKQKIIMLIVKDKLFKYNPFLFSVGDNIDKINGLFKNKQTTIGDIHYYLEGNCMIAIKLKGEIISSYIIWNCETAISDIKGKHPIVVNYLK